MDNQSGLTFGSGLFSQPTKIDQQKPGVEVHKSRMENVIAGTASKVAIKIARNGMKLPDMMTLLRHLAVEGVYYYVVEDMIVVPIAIPLVGTVKMNNLMRGVMAVLGKSGIEWTIDQVQKTKAKPFKELILDEALAELLVFTYRRFTQQISVPDSGSSRVFIT